MNFRGRGRGREQADKLLLLEANVKELAKGDKLWIEMKWAEEEVRFGE